MNAATPYIPRDKCEWCGMIHAHKNCPLIKAIEYYENGATKRIELLTPADKIPPAFRAIGASLADPS